MKNEKNDKRLDLVMPISLYHRLVNKQIEIYKKTLVKPTIAALIREAIEDKYKGE